MKDITKIRPSQFLTTYGAGSLVDIPVAGTCIMKDYNTSQVLEEGIDVRFILGYPNLTRMSKNLEYSSSSEKPTVPIGIFRFPSNSYYERKGDEEVLYLVDRFPSWSLCTQHGSINILYKRDNQNHQPVCPKCLTNRKQNNNTDFDDPEQIRKDRLKADSEAIRFIQICAKGHLDDLDWDRLVHNEVKNHTTYFIWEIKGAGVHQIIIKCPVNGCNAERNLGSIINQNPLCSGKFPERRSHEDCGLPTQVTLKNSSNVFIPEIKKAISLPIEANSLYKFLSHTEVLTTLKNDWPKLHDFQDFLNCINNANGIPKPKKKFLNEIKKIEFSLAWNIVEYFYANYVENPYNQIGEPEFRLEEFYAFQKKQGSLSINPTLIINKKDMKVCKYGNLKLNIVPITKLEVLVVQEGYRRLCYAEDAPPPELVYTPYIEKYNNQDTHWYPGNLYHGEGIFIELYNGNDPEQNNLDEEKEKSNYNDILMKKLNIIGKEWIESYNFMKTIDFSKTQEDKNKPKDIFDGKDQKKIMDSFKRFDFRNMSNFLHPIAIWWHTLAHRIIKSIAVDCGYSEASLQERIYFDPNKSIGGILIYASTPGEDGTMGGLLAQVPRFNEIMRNALKEIDSCSNDPLCRLHEYQMGELNGAACYVCLFISETSCEFGNIGLDRSLLINTF